MKAFIERIEDGKTAVVMVEKAGQLLIPLKTFPFEVYDGMHLTLEFKPNPKSENKTEEAIKKLREKLLKRTQKPQT